MNRKPNPPITDWCLVQQYFICLSEKNLLFMLIASHDETPPCEHILYLWGTYSKKEKSNNCLNILYLKNLFVKIRVTSAIIF